METIQKLIKLKKFFNHEVVDDLMEEYSKIANSKNVKDILRKADIEQLVNINYNELIK